MSAAPEIPPEAFEVFATGVDHAECVAFDSEGTLWAGGEAGQIYRFAPDGTHETLANLGTFNAGLAFAPGTDDLFACNPAKGIVRVRKSGEHEVFASHAGDHKIFCANYGVFLRDDTYFLSDSGHFRQRDGYLLRFTPDGRGEIVAGPLGYTNGLALTADERTLYMVESDTSSVLKFELHPDGSVSAPTTFAEITRFPDGLALDASGNLYASTYASDEIWKIAPDGAKSLFAYDPWAVKLGSPTNIAFASHPDATGAPADWIYVANLARMTITRAKVPFKGQPLANQAVAASQSTSPASAPQKAAR